jgi:hypothetical protein
MSTPPYCVDCADKLASVITYSDLAELASSAAPLPIVYAACLLVPALINDLLRLGRVHHAYLSGIAIMAASIVLTVLVWDWPWWQLVAPTVLGGA